MGLYNTTRNMGLAVQDVARRNARRAAAMAGGAPGDINMPGGGLPMSVVGAHPRSSNIVTSLRPGFRPTSGALSPEVAAQVQREDQDRYYNDTLDQQDFVNRIGQDKLDSTAQSNQNKLDALDWRTRMLEEGRNTRFGQRQDWDQTKFGAQQGLAYDKFGYQVGNDQTERDFRASEGAANRGATGENVRARNTQAYAARHQTRKGELYDQYRKTKSGFKAKNPDPGAWVQSQMDAEGWDDPAASSSPQASSAPAAPTAASVGSPPVTGSSFRPATGATTTTPAAQPSLMGGLFRRMAQAIGNPASQQQPGNAPPALSPDAQAVADAYDQDQREAQAIREANQETTDSVKSLSNDANGAISRMSREELAARLAGLNRLTSGQVNASRGIQNRPQFQRQFSASLRGDGTIGRDIDRAMAIYSDNLKLGKTGFYNSGQGQRLTPQSDAMGKSVPNMGDYIQQMIKAGPSPAPAPEPAVNVPELNPNLWRDMAGQSLDPASANKWKARNGLLPIPLPSDNSWADLAGQVAQNRLVTEPGKNWSRRTNGSGFDSAGALAIQRRAGINAPSFPAPAPIAPVNPAQPVRSAPAQVAQPPAPRIENDLNKATQTLIERARLMGKSLTVEQAQAILQRHAM